MGKAARIILKVILVLLLITLLCGLAYWLCRVKGWPLWVGAALVAGVVGFFLGVLYLKTLLLRSRERRFVQRVIDQDRQAIKDAPVSERIRMQELQEHWKASVKRLQGSRLRKKGNPLYALPWFLIMGESRTGKTSAIRNSRLSSSMTEVSRASGISGTRNCDWWFFEQAVILDTAGRYTIPIDESPDLEEWEQFLTLLAKYRKREPLNGVIVGISADKLLSGDEKKLREDGQSIRRRIDQMMRIMGAKFPVYVLVTKMDLVHGFTDFTHRLPPESMSQAMGYMNADLNPYWKDVSEEGLKKIAEDLKALRLILVNRSEGPSPGTLLFPDEFERLGPGLNRFLESIFEENAFQETPLLRGLYFSSARREGEPVSEFLTLTGLEARTEPEPDQEAGLFLKDFFQSILPEDRNVFRPILEFIVWKRLTRNLGLLSWLLIGFSVCGLLAFSYVHNHQTIKGFTREFYNPPQLSGDRAADLLTLDKMRLEILDMMEDNRSWLLPRFGLDHSIEVVDGLKTRFSELFQKGFLVPMDQRLTRSIERVTRDTPEETFVDYIGYAVARITVLKEHLEGRDLTLAGEFRMIASDLLMARDTGIPPEIAAKFGDIYYAYLTWSEDRPETQERLEEFQMALVELLNKKGSDLRWLVQKWVPGAPDVRLTDFWGVSESGDFHDGVRVPGAFTAEGRENVHAFIRTIEDALDDESVKPIFEKHAQAFWSWYEKAFFEAWYAFIKRFHDGMNRGDTGPGWRRMASLMTTDQNPYFLLLDRVAREITALDPGAEAPDWAGMATRLYAIRKLARDESAKQKGQSVAQHFEKDKEAVLESAYRNIDKKKARQIEERVQQAKAWNAYVQALQKIDMAVANRKQSYDMYAQCFSYLGASSRQESPFSVTYRSYYKLKDAVVRQGHFPVVWDMVFGPFAYLIQFAADETACFLQNQWEDQVLSAVPGTDPDKLPGVLFDKSEGVVWKFLESVGKPFIGRNKNGYYSREDFRGNHIPFHGAFIHFLNQGKAGVLNAQPQYTVSMKTLPLEVNSGASVEPYGCVLELHCAGGKQRLENYNYTNSATFEWDPGKCGDVTLTLSFPDLTLKRAYPGRMGFAEFLKAFRDGTHTFEPEAFPGREEDLKNLKVDWIKIAYQMSGSEPVIELLNRAPTQVPSKIVPCWTR
jgi:type VI secretion system protein ImpL